MRPHKSPDLPVIFAAARNVRGKVPIIIVPGVLGSQLVDKRTGAVVWPSASHFEDDIDLPIDAPLPECRDNLVTSRIVMTTRLSRLLPEVRVYADLLEALTRTAGYRPASLDDPPADGDADTFYVFPYDWRRDNVENARLLGERIAFVKARLQRPDLRFNIVAHSMGGLVARYYALYGHRDLDGAPPDWSGASNINRLILVGTPSAGAMDALRSLVDGYNWYGGNYKRSNVFNKLDWDLILSLPSIYQLLPSPGTGVVVDEKLQTHPVDLFDPLTWSAHGWSIYAPRHRAKVTRELGAERAAVLLAQQERFLALVLDRARRFHDALEAQSGTTPPMGLYVFGGDCEPTLRAPLVVNHHGQPRTYFHTIGKLGSLRFDKTRLKQVMFAPGDGRVTRASLLGEPDGPSAVAPFKSVLGLDYVLFHCEVHGDLPNNGALQDNLLNLLVSDAYRVRTDGVGSE
jgi:pimeloyl-ACP methyl ester carboxylesterase